MLAMQGLNRSMENVLQFEAFEAQRPGVSLDSWNRCSCFLSTKHAPAVSSVSSTSSGLGQRQL
jgi:hypothetical protein